jgi:hypothetical protein
MHGRPASQIRAQRSVDQSDCMGSQADLSDCMSSQADQSD